MIFRELYLLIDHSRYYFLKFVLEGYDGLCLLSTVKGHRGCICLRYPPETQTLLFELLNSLVPSIEKGHEGP